MALRKHQGCHSNLSGKALVCPSFKEVIAEAGAHVRSSRSTLSGQNMSNRFWTASSPQSPAPMVPQGRK